jgi:phosphoglycolate phosphatase
VLRAALFDFHGVLVDDAPIRFECLRRVLAEEGVEPAREVDFEPYRGLDDRTLLSRVLVAYGQEPSPFRLVRLGARQSTYYQEQVRSGGLPLASGAAELVASLAEDGWMLGVVSEVPREEIDGALARAGLRERFKALVGAEDVSSLPPDPEGYSRAIEALNSQPPLPERLFHPHEILALVASPASLAAARDLGFPTLAVSPRGFDLPADLTVPSLLDLTPARLRRRFAEVSRS